MSDRSPEPISMGYSDSDEETACEDSGSEPEEDTVYEHSDGGSDEELGGRPLRDYYDSPTLPDRTFVTSVRQISQAEQDELRRDLVYAVPYIWKRVPDEFLREAVVELYNKKHNEGYFWSPPESDIAQSSPDGDVCSKEDLEALAESKRRLNDLKYLEEEYERIKAFLKAHPGPGKSMKPWSLESPPDPPPVISLPPIPAPFRTVDRNYSYGWPVSDAWLRIFRAAANDQQLFQWSSPRQGVNTLRELSGCDWPYLTGGVHPYAPTGEGEDGPEITLMHICNTSSVLRYHGFRPTEEQFEWLKGLFHREPQWYRSTLCKEEWDYVRESNGFLW
ncbi:hypothetical protein OH77DRAFT_1590592 [Trametes cingulata]|nr:hypothetical protein OH77DRAFT_1590592 [Trametes cingulata]